MIGIYAIASPDGRIFIGQSNYISLTFSAYKTHGAKKGSKLAKSFAKYEVGNHSFIRVQECKETELDTLELKHRSRHSHNSLNCDLPIPYKRWRPASENKVEPVVEIVKQEKPKLLKQPKVKVVKEKVTKTKS